MSLITDAIDRLTSFYNDGVYDVVGNPGGFDQNGHQQNFIDALRDVGIVGAALAAATGSSSAALTTFDDANVTLTLGGSPTSALLAATSITVGWSGQLPVARGGTGAATLTGILQGNGTGAVSALADSTVGRVLRVTGANTFAFGAVDLADTDAVTGTLPAARGGTGAATLTGILQGNGTGAFTALADSTVGRVLRVTGANTFAFGAVDLADTDAVTGTLPIARGGTGATTLTDHGVLVGSGTSAIDALAVGATKSVLQGSTGADPAFTTTPAVEGITITPTTSSLNLAIDTTTTNAGSYVGSNRFGFAPIHNYLTTGIDASGSTALIVMGRLNEVYPDNSSKSNIIAGVDAVTVEAGATITTTTSTLLDFVGHMAYGKVSRNLGGTNLVGGERGGIFGGYDVAIAGAAATNIVGLIGREINVQSFSGSTMVRRLGLTIVAFAPSESQGSIYDAALSVTASGGIAKPWLNAILLSASSGGNPLDTTNGAILNTVGAATTKYGIKIDGYTFTTAAFQSSGFVVDGSGALTANGGIGTSGGLTVSAGGASVAGGLTVSSGTTAVAALTATTGLFTGQITSTLGVGSQQLDMSSQAASAVADNANVAIAGGGGHLIIVSDATFGHTGVYVGDSVGGYVLMVADAGGTWIAPTTTPGAGKQSVQWDGASNVKIYNHRVGTISYRAIVIKIR